jgi:hypothetical protein
MQKQPAGYAQGTRQGDQFEFKNKIRGDLTRGDMAEVKTSYAIFIRKDGYMLVASVINDIGKLQASIIRFKPNEILIVPVD